MSSHKIVERRSRGRRSIDKPPKEPTQRGRPNIIKQPEEPHKHGRTPTPKSEPVERRPRGKPRIYREGTIGKAKDIDYFIQFNTLDNVRKKNYINRKVP